MSLLFHLSVITIFICSVIITSVLRQWPAFGFEMKPNETSSTSSRDESSRVQRLGLDVGRKKCVTIKKLMPQDEIALSQNIENYEHERKCVVSNSKESLSIPSGQSLSRITTPEIPLTVIDNTGDAKEMTSLVKVKDFEDFVREAIQTGLLVKQYEVRFSLILSFLRTRIARKIARGNRERRRLNFYERDRDQERSFRRRKIYPRRVIT